MLKLTRKVEYALMALQHMRSKEAYALSSAKEISEACDIPGHLLAKIMQQLAKQDIVEPVQGPNGGYRLKPAWEGLNLIRFFEILEGPVGLMDCYFDSSCAQISQCSIRHPIVKINQSLRDFFHTTMVSDIVNQ